MRAIIMAAGLLTCAIAAHASEQLPNNFPFPNAAGTAATYRSDGSIDFTHPFHTPLGTNGRTCESCHLPQAGWSVRPIDVELLFFLTNGTDPMFNALDADRPVVPASPRRARYEAFSMLRKGLFRRGGELPGTAEFEIVSVDDPLNSGASLTRFVVFRRPLATANFHIAANIGWHDQNTNGSRDIPSGLANQATGAIVNAEQGPAPTSDVVSSIVSYQRSLSFAQQSIYGIGSLTSCSGRGGPQHLSDQLPVNGRFDLYDAWIGLVPGACSSKSADRRRAQIARGQEIFNGVDANGRSCRGCHNAQNNGSNLNGVLFDVGASRAQFRKSGMPLYTLRHKTTGEIRQTTDPGRALRSGLWADLDKFKTPSLRGLAARAPYFHNGIAANLTEVVQHYETALGFSYTAQQRADLVAFMEAL